MTHIEIPYEPRELQLKLHNEMSLKRWGVVVLLVGFSFCGLDTVAGEWPEFRGPGGDGRVVGLRPGYICRTAGQNPGNYPTQRIRPCCHDTGNYYHSRPGFRGQPVSPADRLDETLYQRRLSWPCAGVTLK